MESTGKVIAVTGSRGKLAPFVIGALGTAGYRVATDNIRAGTPLDLDVRDEAEYLVEQWRKRFERIDGVILLTGLYEPGKLDDAADFADTMTHNVMPAVNVLAPLLQELQEREGSVIAMDASVGLQPKEAGYRAGKAALDAYMRSLSFERPLIDVSYIRPDGPIDTDEKRSHLAGVIVSLLKREPHEHA